MNLDYELAKTLGYPKNGYILFEDNKGNCIHAKRTTKPYEHDYQKLTFNVSWIPKDILDKVKKKVIDNET